MRFVSVLHILAAMAASSASLSAAIIVEIDSFVENAPDLCPAIIVAALRDGDLVPDVSKSEGESQADSDQTDLEYAQIYGLNDLSTEFLEEFEDASKTTIVSASDGSEEL